MPEIRAAAIVGRLHALLREALEAPQVQATYFVDNRPGAGLFGAIEGLSAAEASRPIAGTSIASHVHHVCFALSDSSAWIQGDRSPRDWSESWQVHTVDGAAWEELQQRLRREYEGLLGVIESHAVSSEDAFGGAIGAIAHTAYHLGAIRQKLAVASVP
jgi:hypothetical protein